MALQVLVQHAKRIYRGLGKDFVSYEGFALPAKHLRLGGKEFKDDAYFLSSARKEARRLRDRCGLLPAGSVLDIGCGVGRLAVGLLAEFGPQLSYTGVDVDASCIAWCAARIQSQHPRFRFVRLDVNNRRYNPAGEPICPTFQLPFAGASFDTIQLYSVFSHMGVEDVLVYLREFRRVIRPGGVIFLTAFVEDGVPEYAENPDGYRMHWQGPLHCVRYDRAFFQDLVRRQGLSVTDFEYGRETDGQSAFYLSPAKKKLNSVPTVAP